MYLFPFDSLPKYLWVPSRFLDNELKRAFVHFNERRIPVEYKTVIRVCCAMQKNKRANEGGSLSVKLQTEEQWEGTFIAHKG